MRRLALLALLLCACGPAPAMAPTRVPRVLALATMAANIAAIKNKVGA